ncbi:hypothetical protein WMF28_36005 [Sorangium sp. So ce590]|uniref:hypothetical protein n=1 Tax=Sorangium sp. So ce590 TaxID=3133317 RepID=UPI003F5DE53F
MRALRVAAGRGGRIGRDAPRSLKVEPVKDSRFVHGSILIAQSATMRRVSGDVSSRISCFI